jgi:hypothetical protein
MGAPVREPHRQRSATHDRRANAEDIAQDIADAEVKIVCRVMSLWGADFYAVGKMFDMSKVWREMASNLVTHAIPQWGTCRTGEQLEAVTRLCWTFSGAGKADGTGGVPANAQSMVSAVTSRGAATTSPAPGTTFTAALVTRTGAATTPQPARLAVATRIRMAPSRRLGRIEWVKGFILPSVL